MSPVVETAIRPDEVSSSRAPRRVPALGIVGPDRLQSPAEPAVDPRVAGRRRRVNVALAVLLLIAVSPLMLVIALLVKLTSRGPVIYSQTRVGIDRRRPGPRLDQGMRQLDYGGRLFTIYKFRTMAADPHSKLQIWARPDDSRVTRLGRVLRKYRLDELPQLVNVIRGDMNLVGPRPEQPNIFLELRDEVERYQERQRVLPGITGWAQINHHYDRTIDDVRAKLRYDLEYIRRQSVLRDVIIMLRTIPVILFQRGAW